MTELIDKIMDLELSFWNAAGHPAAYESGMAEDGVAILPMVDGILGKKQVLSAISAGQPWDDVEIKEKQLLEIMEDVVALIYEATGLRSGQTPYHAFISSVYRHTETGWQSVVHQQTPLPESQQGA